MNMLKLVSKLSNTYLCRCKFWVICDNKDCLHFEPHSPIRDHCIMLSPVKYCSNVRGFVYDIPMADIDSNYDCDPNLAFKAKRDSEQREARREAGTDTVTYAQWKESMRRRELRGE